MEEPTVIIVNPNGPLKISGNFVIKDPQGKDFDLSGRTAISLVPLRIFRKQAVL